MNSYTIDNRLPPLTVVKAGAGAGKTHKIQTSIADWILSGKIKADRILAVTFTNAAANEMKNRIRQDLLRKGCLTEADQVQQATITTIHGFGLTILKRFSYELGLSPEPRQLTDAEQDILIREALTHTDSIHALLNELDKFGYRGVMVGADYIDGASQLKNAVLQVIRNLRSIGKGADLHSSGTLLRQAETALSHLYGQGLSQASTLNTALWTAVSAVHRHFPDLNELDQEWASNADTRNFVSAIKQATKEKIESDWRLWKSLQSIDKAPKILGKNASSAAPLALDIWPAADKLSVHPGPLNDEIIHIQSLLQSAMDALTEYQKNKEKAGLVDYADMVQQAERILSQPAYLDEIKSRYDCLIIDEFQDTNPLQFSLLYRLTQAGLPTFIVGDLKQSIMGFQGADPRLFSQLVSATQARNDNQNYIVDELTNNWRSTRKLMDFINQAGTQLYAQHYQALTVRDEANYDSDLVPVHLLTFDTDNWGEKRSKNKAPINDEGHHSLAHHIKNLIDSKVLVTDKESGQKRIIQPNDIAVLAATHQRLLSFSEKLNQIGITSKLTQTGLLASECVQWIISALKYVRGKHNHYALLNLLTSDFTDLSLQEALSEYLEHKQFSHPVVKLLDDHAKSIGWMNMENAVINVISLLDIDSRLVQRSDYAQQRANILKLVSLASQFDQMQAESLQAMGIYGKHLDTFLLWLKESAAVYQSDSDKQPHEQLNAQNSVVLSTWHASKGLEWPVVMVLDLHTEKKAQLPSIGVEYLSDELDSILSSSYVRLLPKFDDDNSSEKLLAALEETQSNNLKNLAYVVLTRAREHLILPWMDNGKDNSMLALIKPVFDHPQFTFKTSNVIQIDSKKAPATTFHNDVIKLCHEETASIIPAVVSPSEIYQDTVAPVLEANATHYSDKLELANIDSQLAANQVGDLLHKLYEVWLLKPELLNRAWGLFGHLEVHDVTRIEIEKQLNDFVNWLTTELSSISLQAEVSILSVNDLGQTISGTIDLLVETADSYWIIDHKTDKTTELSRHIAQLRTYADCLALDKPVSHLAINWVRESLIESVEI